MVCSGNSGEFCGGPNRLNVYNYTGTGLGSGVVVVVVVAAAVVVEEEEVPPPYSLVFQRAGHTTLAGCTFRLFLGKLNSKTGNDTGTMHMDVSSQIRIQIIKPSRSRAALPRAPPRASHLPGPNSVCNVVRIVFS
jgi:hypothetical protein